MSAIFLYLCEFVIFKFQPVAHIGAEGQQGDGDFGDHAGLVVLDEGVITADIHNGTEHNILLLKNRPGGSGAVIVLGNVRN